METERIGKEYYSQNESDIIDLKWTENFGLKVKIATWKNKDAEVGIEYEFEEFNGFRYLDEGDLLSYWDLPDFKNGYHLFKIIKGGWKSGEIKESGILDVSKAINQLNEFFITTSNGCLTVLTYGKPKISEIEFENE